MIISNKEKICNEILAYLVDHPSAQDTLEGILNWWLLERAIKFQKVQVKKALNELIDKGFIIERKSGSSEAHYRLNHRKMKEINESFKLMDG